MKCNVVLKAAHGQPAAFDIDHMLINLLETVSVLCLYAVLVKCLDTLLFFMFLKEVSYNAHQASIYLIRNTDKISNIVKYYNLK